MSIEFTDGIKFDNVHGKPRIEQRFDGLYVIGGGMLIPVESRREAEETLKEELEIWESEHDEEESA